MITVVYETGLVIPMYHDNFKKDRLEGWAKLIKPTGKILTFIPSEFRESDEEEVNYSVYSKQKWLIKWVDIELYPNIKRTLSVSEIMTQGFLKGKKTGRYLYNSVGDWSEIRKIGKSTSSVSEYSQKPIVDTSDDSIIF